MKRVFSALLSAAVLMAASPAVFAAGEAVSSEQPGYIARVLPGAEEAASLSGCERIGGDFYFAPSMWEIDALAAAGVLAGYEENKPLSLSDYSEGYEPALWHLKSIGVSAAWAHKNADGEADRMGDGVTVAVVDSGVMVDHPDLAGANILEPIILSSDEDGIDDYHGTFIAGIFAAGVNNNIGVDGIVPNVTILPICITAQGGKTDVATAVSGIYRAVEEGADVIIFSIGGTSGDDALRSACEYATSNGVIFVTCSGNYSGGHNKSSSNYMYPAAYDSTVTVSACRQSGSDAVFDDSYSYFNDAVTVSAPGTNISSLYLDGGTATRTGTSFAAPIVAAMAVMAKQAIPDIGKEDFVELLKASSIDLGDEGYDNKYGYGYVNIPAFLTVLDEAAAALQPEQPAEGGSEGGEGGGSSGEASPSENPPADAEPTEEEPAEPLAYSDVSDDTWGLYGIRYVTEHGLMNGVEGGLFAPERSVSRAMLVTILWRLSGEPVVENEPGFTDAVPGEWYDMAVRWAVSQGIVNGYGDGRFGPSDGIKREQFATILFRYARYVGVLTAPEAPSAELPDMSGVSDWALESVSWAFDKGLLADLFGGEFIPSLVSNRAETAMILTHYCENLA